MSFRWYSSEGVTIDTLADTIMDELINNGGWTNTDDGYCVTDPNATFDLAITLEAVNKRFFQFEIADQGIFNTGTHTMGTPKISYGHTFVNDASANGADECNLYMSYDDEYVIIITDFTAEGANYRRCLSYHGLLYPLESTDECITGGATLFRDTTPAPTNDETTTGEIILLDDVSHAANKPSYCVNVMQPISGGSSNGQPKIIIQSAVINKRYLISPYVSSHTSYPAANGEVAGFRAYFRNMYAGGAYDGMTHGQVLEASDGKEYYYFEQDTQFSYFHIPTALLVRKV